MVTHPEAMAVRRIVVGVDGGPGGRDAIAFAETLASAAGTRLILAHTVCYGLHPARVQDREAWDLGFALVDGEARAAGVDAERRVLVEESVPSGLVQLARATQADLVVVGSPRRGPLIRAVLGDNARGLLDVAAWPVAVVPEGWRRLDVPAPPVVVGYDATTRADTVLRLGVELARVLDAPLRAVEVVTSDRGSRARTPQARRAALGHVKKACAGASPELVVRRGEPDEQLAIASRQASVLVVGNRLRGAMGRRLFGSTAHALVGHVASPLIVVPTPGPQPLLGGTVARQGEGGHERGDQRDGGVDPEGLREAVDERFRRDASLGQAAGP